MLLQALDLAPRQGDADFTDPFQFHPLIGLALKLVKVDQRQRLSPLDRLQIALAGFRRTAASLTIEARQRMALFAINHDNVRHFRISVAWNRRILRRQWSLPQSGGQFDLAETFRGTCSCSGSIEAPAPTRYDRHRVQFEIVDDWRYFRCLDPASARISKPRRDERPWRPPDHPWSCPASAVPLDQSGVQHMAQSFRISEMIAIPIIEIKRL